MIPAGAGLRTEWVESARTTAVLAALDREPGLTVRELAARTGYGTRLLHMLLLRLAEDGRAIHEANRWYSRPTRPSSP